MNDPRTVLEALDKSNLQNHFPSTSLSVLSSQLRQAHLNTSLLNASVSPKEVFIQCLKPYIIKNYNAFQPRIPLPEIHFSLWIELHSHFQIL